MKNSKGDIPFIQIALATVNEIVIKLSDIGGHIHQVQMACTRS